MEAPPNTDRPVRNAPAVGEPMQAYREVAQAVIASAVTDLVKGRARAEEAYQFLCGAGDDHRAMLEFWCFVAEYSADQVMSTVRARSLYAWRVWWLAEGKHRLQQIQTRLEQMRPRFVSVNAGIGSLVTEEERDGRWRVMATGGLKGKHRLQQIQTRLEQMRPRFVSVNAGMASPEHLAILKRGVEEWNAWRREHGEICPERSGANLCATTLREANLHKVHLDGDNLGGADVNLANLSRATLREAPLRGKPQRAPAAVPPEAYELGRPDPTRL